MRRHGLFGLAALGLVAASGAAEAGPVLDRIRATHTIHCGATARPGLYDQAEDGKVTGLLVDLCHAVGVVAAGPDVQVDAHVYYADQTYDPLRQGSDDLAFLTGTEIITQKLESALVPGPAAYVEHTAAMVTATAAAKVPVDLAGQPVCFLEGDGAHHDFEAYMAARHLDFVRMGYQEPIEMYDAFDAGKCKAIVGEASTLADIRTDGGPTRRSARILDEPLAQFPILTATGAADGQWSATVAWVLATLQNADRPKRDWSAGGLDSLPLDLSALGLKPGWQTATLAANGSYATMVARDMGAGSALNLPAGVNALAPTGGAITPPYQE